MKSVISIAIIGLVVSIFPAVISVGTDEYELRGPVFEIGSYKTPIVFSYLGFTGFYYDINDDVGAEQITFRQSDTSSASSTLSDQLDADGKRGIEYTTHARDKDFMFKPWGQYKVIGFLGDGYLAAYDNSKTAGMNETNEPVAYLYDTSRDRNLMTKECLSKVLIDDSSEQTFTSAKPLKLQEGYELNLKNIDSSGNRVTLELTKNGLAVDGKTIQPNKDNAKMSDKTYYYTANLGNIKGIVQIAVHFKNAFSNVDTNIATIDGVFQISDTATPIESGQQFDKMSIRDNDPPNFKITMDNKDSSVILSKDTDTVLMQNIYIKTANQDLIDDAHPLRFYLYKKLKDPGRYEIRGHRSSLSSNASSWDSRGFAGFYYDLDEDIGTENLAFRLLNIDSTTARLIDEPVGETEYQRGIVYTTKAQPKSFKFKPWGQFEAIGFLGEPFFAAYNDNQTQGMEDAGVNVAYLYDKSKNRNLMAKVLLSKILIDDNKEQVIKKDSSLMLKEGYELALKGLNDNGYVYVELLKNGQTIDSKVVEPSIDNAGMADKTYYYKTDLGDVKEIVTIAVHFKNSYKDEEKAFATVDGIWQISDDPISIEAERQFDKMSIRTVDATDLIITMDNKDNQIVLSKNGNVTLMQNIYLRTADQDIIDEATPLRYYIYTPVIIESEATSEMASTISSNNPEVETPSEDQKPVSKAVDAGI